MLCVCSLASSERLTVVWAVCRCFLSLVFLGGSRRLELSPCTCDIIGKVFLYTASLCAARTVADQSFTEIIRSDFTDVLNDSAMNHELSEHPLGGMIGAAFQLCILLSPIVTNCASNCASNSVQLCPIVSELFHTVRCAGCWVNLLSECVLVRWVNARSVASPFYSFVNSCWVNVNKDVDTHQDMLRQESTIYECRMRGRAIFTIRGRRPPRASPGDGDAHSSVRRRALWWRGALPTWCLGPHMPGQHRFQRTGIHSGRTGRLPAAGIPLWDCNGRC